MNKTIRKTGGIALTAIACGVTLFALMNAADKAKSHRIYYGRDLRSESNPRRPAGSNFKRKFSVISEPNYVQGAYA